MSLSAGRHPWERNHVVSNVATTRAAARTSNNRAWDDGHERQLSEFFWPGIAQSNPRDQTYIPSPPPQVVRLPATYCASGRDRFSMGIQPGACTARATLTGVYCEAHSCVAVLDSGDRCPNWVSERSLHGYCSAGYHDETGRADELQEQIEHRVVHNAQVAAARLAEFAHFQAEHDLIVLPASPPPVSLPTLLSIPHVDDLQTGDDESTDVESHAELDLQSAGSDTAASSDGYETEDDESEGEWEDEADSGYDEDDEDASTRVPSLATSVIDLTQAPTPLPSRPASPILISRPASPESSPEGSADSDDGDLEESGQLESITTPATPCPPLSAASPTISDGKAWWAKGQLLYPWPGSSPRAFVKPAAPAEPTPTKPTVPGGNSLGLDLHPSAELDMDDLDVPFPVPPPTRVPTPEPTPCSPMMARSVDAGLSAEFPCIRSAEQVILPDRAVSAPGRTRLALGQGSRMARIMTERFGNGYIRRQAFGLDPLTGHDA